MRYEAPLRCESCGTVIEKKPKAKTPKYCVECRERQQNEWREKNKNAGLRRSIRVR